MGKKVTAVRWLIRIVSRGNTYYGSRESMTHYRLDGDRGAVCGKKIPEHAIESTNQYNVCSKCAAWKTVAAALGVGEE